MRRTPPLPTAVRNASHTTQVRERRENAMRQAQAGHAAGRGRRSI